MQEISTNVKATQFRRKEELQEEMEKVIVGIKPIEYCYFEVRKFGTIVRIL